MNSQQPTLPVQNAGDAVCLPSVDENGEKSKSSKGLLTKAPLSSIMNPKGAGGPAVSKIRRRNRLITSCLECRRRKLKCDKTNPCINCTKSARECIFMSKEDLASQSRLLEMKEKVGTLERELGKEIINSLPLPTNFDKRLPLENKEEEEEEDFSEAEDERGLEPTPLASLDAAYEADGEDDELLDLGIQIGRMRITERIGGFFRPKLAEELSAIVNKDIKIPEATSEQFRFDQPQTLFTQSVQDSLKPGPSYIPPSSSVLFGHSRIGVSWQTYLPTRQSADRLISHYFEAVHPIARCVHRQSFNRDYDMFWQHASYGVEPLAPLQVVIFAAMFSAAVSMEEIDILREFGIGKQNLVNNFKNSVETALTRANLLRTTTVATLQGFVMYMIPLCREELSRAHSVLVGAAIRLAECMGLHRDGEHYGLSPIETHVRRLVWHQLCFLDIRTCEVQGPRPSIRREDYDTKLPLNVDDIELLPGHKLSGGVDRWTDCTFSLMRFEINNLFRTVWVERPRIEKRQTSLTALLAKVEDVRKSMAAKYDHLFDENIPLHKAAKLVKALLLARTHVMILHRYHNSVTSKMPVRLREMMVQASLQTMECGINLEVLPDLGLWKWYVGAYTQYHAAFLLLCDCAIYGNDMAIDRIWECLNYIFQADPNIPREERSQKILKEIWEKTTLYNQKRKMKAPSTMNNIDHLRISRRITTQTSKPYSLQNPETPPPAIAVHGYTQPYADYTTSAQYNAGMPYLEANYGRNLENNPKLVATSSMYTPSPLQSQSSPRSMLSQDALMADIDWDAFDALFPPEQMMADFYACDFPTTNLATHY